MTFVRRLRERLPRPVGVGVDLAVATVRDSGRDRVPGLAAEIAFWVLLSLPPLLLVAASAAGFVGDAIGEDVRTQLIDRVRELSLQIFSADTVEATIAPTLDGLLRGGSTSVLSLSFVATLYSASRVLRVVVLALTIAYDLEDKRPTWVARLLGLLLTVGGVLVGAILIPVLVAGPQLGAIVEGRVGMEIGLGEVYRVLYWPTSLAIVSLLIAALYHWSTPWTTPFRRELPGAVLATVLGLAASFGLRTYTRAAFEGDALYATLAAPLAILIWVWLQGMSLLLGAELNAEIEKTFPSGPPPRDAPDLGELGRRAVEGVRRVTPLKRGGRTDDEEEEAHAQAEA